MTLKGQKEHRWSKEELETLKSLVDKGTPYWEVSEIMDMPRSAVNTKAIRMGWRYKGNFGANCCEHNGNWLGVNVSYRGVHRWVRRRKIQPERCEICGAQKDRLDLANLSGDYKRDLEDWIYLCRRCHMKTDGRLERWNLRRIIDMVNGNVKRDEKGRLIGGD
jgi:hypothetical protein